MLEKDCAVIITLYGDEESRILATEQVIQKIINSQLFKPNVYLVYLSFEENTYFQNLQSEINLIRIQGTENNKNLFQKESLYNIAISKSDEKYLAFLDGDLYSEDPLWMMKVFDTVDRHEQTKTDTIVQMFKTFSDPVEGKFSFSHSYFLKNEKEVREKAFSPGAPGGGWALSRRLLNKGRNFNQWCIPGSGDCCFIMEYSGISKYFDHHMGYKWFVEIFRGDLNINANLDYVDVDLIHIYHGEYKNRAYKMSRIIIDHFEELKDLVEIDKNKLLSWKDPNCGLRFVLSDKSKLTTEKDAHERASQYINLPALPEIEDRIILNDTALITCYFGDNEKFLKSCKQSFEQLIRLNPTPLIVFVEIVTEGEETKWEEIGQYDFVKHIQVKGKEQHANLFQKEACFNIGARSLDLEQYKYLIFHDSDSYPTIPNWANIIRGRIKKWIDDNNQENYLLQNFSIYSDSTEQKQTNGYVFEKTRDAINTIGFAPGLSWSMPSSFFQKVNGWYIKAFTGPNDAIALKRWDTTYRYSDASPELTWMQNIYKEISDEEHKAITDFIPASIVHVFHGVKSSRGYKERQNVISWLCSNVNDVVCEDDNGLLAWKEPKNSIALIMEKTKNFTEEKLTSSIIADILIEEKRKGTIACLSSHLDKAINKIQPTKKHTFTEFQPENVKSLAILINGARKSLFSSYETEELPNGLIKVIDKIIPSYFLIKNKNNIKSRIDIIQNTETIQDAFKNDELVFFLVDLPYTGNTILKGLRERLSSKHPNSWLLLLEYEDMLERGPLFYAGEQPKTIRVVMKKTEDGNDPEILLQHEILLNILSNDRNTTNKINYKKHFHIPENTMMGNGSLSIVGDGLLATENIEGDAVEIGCNKGKTSLFIRKTLEEIKDDRTFHVFDSFEGLSEPAEVDKIENTKVRKGCMKAPLLEFKQTFIGEKLPVIHKGFVEDTLENELPEKLSFALIDCDLYDPIKFSAKLVHEKLQKNGVMVIHDYNCNFLPGAKVAIDEFVESHKDEYTFEDHGNIVKLTKK